MLKAGFKLFLFAVSVVLLLAVSGYQSHFNIRRGAAVESVGQIKMGTRRPPSQVVRVEPSMFDWVRYGLEGGPFVDLAKMNSASMTEGMTDLQRLKYRTDVDRRGVEAMTERVEDEVRAIVGEPLTPRGIQFKSVSGQ